MLSYDIPLTADAYGPPLFAALGNSKGCRIVHGTMAALNEKHCPHLSFIPIEDQDNKLRCQESHMRSPSDIFTQWELEKIREVVAEHGLPADTMYREFEYEPGRFGEDQDGFKLGVTESFFSSHYNDCDYMLFYGFILWATIVITGRLGMEYFFYFSLMRADSWDESTEIRWRFVQFCFPLLATTSVGMAHTTSFWAIPLIVVTLFKFGFPAETILFLYSSLFDKSLSRSMRLKDLLDGVGTVIHHSSAALYIAMVLLCIIPSTRATIEVVVPVLVQHWFVLLRYRFNHLYVLIETVLEVWFEMTVLSSLEAMHNEHWVAGIVAVSMLFSHWLYFIAGCLGLLFTDASNRDDVMTIKSHNDNSLHRLKSRRDFRVSVEVGSDVSGDIQSEENEILLPCDVGSTVDKQSEENKILLSSCEVRSTIEDQCVNRQRSISFLDEALHENDNTRTSAE